MSWSGSCPSVSRSHRIQIRELSPNLKRVPTHTVLSLSARCQCLRGDASLLSCNKVIHRSHVSAPRPDCSRRRAGGNRPRGCPRLGEHEHNSQLAICDVSKHARLRHCWPAVRVIGVVSETQMHAAAVMSWGPSPQWRSSTPVNVSLRIPISVFHTLNSKAVRYAPTTKPHT